MKKLILILALVVLATGSVNAAGVISWVRVHTPTMDDYRALTSDTSLDIAAARAGEYVDLIIHGDELSSLASDGYGYEYLMYDIYDPANYEGKGYSNYTNYTEMEGRLDTLVSAYPSILQRTDEGTGRQGTHNIYLIKVSDNVGTSEPSEEKLLVTGVHHAREPMSLEVPLYFLEQLCADYATDTDVQDIINGLELYVIPLLNPEGYHYDDIEGSKNMWRKNSYDWPSSTAPDDWGGGWGTGVDPNRNYSYMWGNGSEWYEQTYCGPSALSEPENQIVADLATNVGFVSAMSFHSYSELILRPWGYTSSDPPAADLAIMDDIGEGYHDVIWDEIGRDYEYQSGWDLYPTNGDFDDYMYGEHGCIPFTIELNSYSQGGFYPDESYIGPTCSGHYEALKWWCLYILGNLTDIDDEGDNPNAPAAFALKPAYPNPASNAATFSFALPETADVTLDIYDVKGRKVLSVLDETVASGENEVAADISSLSSGVYVYKLSAGDNIAAKKMVVR